MTRGKLLAALMVVGILGFLAGLITGGLISGDDSGQPPLTAEDGDSHQVAPSSGEWSRQFPLAHSDLREKGAFGFPQAAAQVLCDRPELRVSLYNDSVYLYVQAVVWGDGDASTGYSRGKEIGDNGSVSLDLDGDMQYTPQVDRCYYVDPRTDSQGLFYTVRVSDRATTGLADDTAGKGAICYAEDDNRPMVRVDSFLIPLVEIGKKPGDRLRLSYFASSPNPVLRIPSADFESATPVVYAHHVPHEAYHEVLLSPQGGDMIDPKAAPFPPTLRLAPIGTAARPRSSD